MMKMNIFIKTSILVLVNAFLSLIWAQQKTDGQGRAEFFKTLFSQNNSSSGNYILKPDESMNLELNLKKYSFPVRRIIRISGGGVFPKPFNERTEDSFRKFLYQMDDCLDSVDTYNGKYSLLFRPEGNNIDQNAFFRISSNEFKAGESVEIILPVKAEELKYYNDGLLQLELQYYFSKVGCHPDDIYDNVDSSVSITIPEGSYAWKELKQKITIPKNVSCILIKLGGKNYSGTCKFGTPEFIQSGKNSVLPFAPYIQEGRNWIGENLSSKEWPVFEFKLNDKVFFSGRVFDRNSEVSEFEIPLPDAMAGKYKLAIKRLTQFPVSYPYKIKQIDIIEKSSRDFEIISVPEYAKVNDNLSILIETNKPFVTLYLSSSKNIKSSQKEVNFPETGLHVVKYHVDSPFEKSFISVSDKKRKERVSIKQILLKKSNNINISTTDEIYIDRNKYQFSNYLEWYLKNGIGNAYGFRPSYQWSGVRVVDSSFYNWALGLLRGLEMPYALMVEGRSLPEKNINPDDEILVSKYYMGRQAHENDGGFYYWGHWQWIDLYWDLMAKYRPQGGIFAKTRPIKTDKGNYIYFDQYAAGNMKEAADNFVNNLKNAKGKSTRHSGPSMMFRYLYQAGYIWLGAEQMYGPEEMVMSSLRGASRVYGKTDYGTHLATQWSSAPYNVPEHSTRLFLSLAISYMHGASHINTEDGLWNMEAGYDRYSESGKEHIMQQKSIYDFIQTHERRGKFVTPTAVIQGRNDAWNNFGRSNAWQQEGSVWKWNRDRESFDLLNVFSPNSKFDAIYVLNCPRKKQGWYSGTPYGPIDLLPIEASVEILKSYKSIAFLGWNSYKEEDFKNLYDFVVNGGTLLIARPHMNTELKYELPAKLPEDKTLDQLLGSNYSGLTEITRRNVGKGKVIYFPKNLYPADPVIRTDYEKELASLGESMINLERKKGWIRGDDLVEFTAYDWNEYRTIYLLNTDWWSDTIQHQAKLLIDDKEYPVNVRRRFIEVITIKDGFAVMPTDMGTDVMGMEIKAGLLIVKLQSTATGKLLVYHAGIKEPIKIPITKTGLQEIKIPIVNN